jgi:hypothetical protein
MSMGSCPAMLTPSSATILPQGVRISADFLKSFPQNQDQTKASLKLLLGEAAHYKIPFRHFITAIQTAGCITLLSDLSFLNFTHSFLPYIPTASCPSEEWDGWD